MDRPGGYTRIIKLAKTRLGDNGQLVLLQLVGQEKKEEAPAPEKKAKKAKKAQ
jgi:large subunit ribosomal protein L17